MSGVAQYAGRWQGQNLQVRAKVFLYLVESGPGVYDISSSFHLGKVELL
jgi:hypothetical protein